MFKAGKYVVKHPKKAVEVVHAGQQICDSVIKTISKKKHESDELDPQMQELLTRIDDLEKEFEAYKNDQFYIELLNRDSICVDSVN